jgi:hypothetical protein
MTSAVTFATLKGWGLEVATTNAASIKNTSKRPASILTGSCGTPVVSPDNGKEALLPKETTCPGITFNGSNITLGLRQAQKVNVDLFDVRGRFVGCLFSGYKDKGVCVFPVNTKLLKQGIYTVRCTTQGSVLTAKITAFQ